MEPSTIRQIRTSQRLTRAQFAELIGVHPDTVKWWEYGYQRPGRFAQRELARFAERARQVDAILGTNQPPADEADSE